MAAGYECWLVDLDGTLVDVSPEYVYDVVEQVASRVDVQLSHTEADQLWRGLRGDPERLLRAKGVDPAAFWAAYHDVEDPLERADATFLYPDASVIGELPGPVGLVTHCQPYLTEPVLSALDIEDWFDVVVCCNDDLGWKPDPGPVQHAMTALGRSEDEPGGVFVGDTATDVGAAWNAGLDAVHVERHGPETRGCCVRADLRLTELTDLPELTPERAGPAVPSNPRRASD